MILKNLFLKSIEEANNIFTEFILKEKADLPSGNGNKMHLPTVCTNILEINIVLNLSLLLDGTE